jgi:sugar (pentulose or hexulose) kinase
MIAEVQGAYTMTDNEIVWTIFHSLAKRYGEVFQMLQSLSPWTIEALYVIGGGVNNKYLLDLTEKAVGVPVIPGTVEATTLGNIIMQKSAI